MPRPFNTSSPLGKLMVQREISVDSLARMSAVNQRHLSDYLARRKYPSATHLKLISDALGIDPQIVLDYELAARDPDGKKSADPTTGETVDRPPLRIPSRSALVGATRALARSTRST